MANKWVGKMKVLLMVWAAMFWAIGAWAHSPLDITTPSNGTTLSVAPSHIVMEYKREIRLTRVIAVSADETRTDLDLGAQTQFSRNYTIPFSANGSGEYAIEWRGLSADGHALNGTFTFTVE